MTRKRKDSSGRASGKRGSVARAKTEGASKKKHAVDVVEIHGSTFINADAITGAIDHLADNSVDVIITDPPYGIHGDRLHQHYNRDERFVVDGYIEVPAAEYNEFTHGWVKQAERVLRPGGSIYIVSGYTNLYDVLDALRDTKLVEINHLIWKYNFGVFTSRKYVSSHYHILYYEKPGGRRTFNLQSRYATNEAADEGGSSNYRDREDVFVINREYKPGQEKNKNELPWELLKKLLQYSTQEGDLVCDFFMGGCSTAAVAIGMNRRFIGFELSKPTFKSRVPKIGEVVPGNLLGSLRIPENGQYTIENAGKAWSQAEIDALLKRYHDLATAGNRKGEIIETLCTEYGRGYWSVVKLLKKLNGRVSEVSRRSRKGPPDIGKIATHQQLALLEEQPRD
jgi:site-specific DNA-methyltransferase (adenine-specific)